MGNRASGRIALGFLIIIAAASATPRASAQAQAGEKVYQGAVSSTVWVVSRVDDQNVIEGTGTIVDRGHLLVLTCYHVVGNRSTVQILFPIFRKGKLVQDREEYRKQYNREAFTGGKVLALDTTRDLAVIELEAPAPVGATYMRLARDNPSTAQLVHSIGNSGLENTLWNYLPGTVTSVGRKEWKVKEGARTLNFSAEVVQTQSPTNPGDSGGPLFNDRGELVAVTQGANEAGRLISYFISVNEVRSFLKIKGLLTRLPGPRDPDNAVTIKPRPPVETAATTPKDPAQEAEKRAASKLNHARDLADKGKPELAKERCEEILTHFPKTKAAQEAKTLLDELNK